MTAATVMAALQITVPVSAEIIQTSVRYGLDGRSAVFGAYGQGQEGLVHDFLGNSNAVVLGPDGLQALSLIDLHDYDVWDKQSFVYVQGKGMTFELGGAVGQWGESVSAVYSYTERFQNTTQQAKAFKVTLDLLPSKAAFSAPGNFEQAVEIERASASFQGDVRLSSDDPYAGVPQGSLDAEYHFYGSVFSDQQARGVFTSVSSSPNLSPPVFSPGFDGWEFRIAEQRMPAQQVVLDLGFILPGETKYFSYSMMIDTGAFGSSVVKPLSFAFTGDPLHIDFSDPGLGSPERFFAPETLGMISAVPLPTSAIMLVPGMVVLFAARRRAIATNLPM